MDETITMAQRATVEYAKEVAATRNIVAERVGDVLILSKGDEILGRAEIDADDSILLHALGRILLEYRSRTDEAGVSGPPR